jgi:RND family efflux transporter MFP subunit
MKLRFFVLLVIATGSLTHLFGCGGGEVEEAPPVVRPVKTMVLGGGPEGRRGFPGTVLAGERVVLSFRVGGPVIELKVVEGQQVRKGQVLARIDPLDYRIALDEAKAAFIKAEADYKRYQRLYEQNAVPLADLEFRRAQRDVAKARKDEAETNLDYTNMRAPFSGRIGERYIDQFEEVRSNQQIVTLNNVSMVDIVLDVPEQLMATARGDDLEAVATFEAAPGIEYPLTVKEVGVQADPQTRTYKVTLTMPQPEEVRLLTGMTGNVTLRFLGSKAGEENRFIVPGAAVFYGDDGTPHVWVVDEDQMTVHARVVEVGAVTGVGNIWLLAGVETGERIATAGVSRLHEEMKIHLME